MPSPLEPPSEHTARAGRPLREPWVDGPLAEQLAAEMAQRWQRGERPLAEEFLDRHPELWQQPEDAAALIYEEICLRLERQEENPAADILHRFPRWRAQLEALLRFHDLLGAGRAPTTFPAAGESLGEFSLLAELGRGASGRVFLARQPSLAGRLVVLKLMPNDQKEHVSLARLQHTHIVPLYFIQEHPAHNLRLLCMPYLGGTTLARVLAGLADRPPERRRGEDLLRALDEARLDGAAPLPRRGPRSREYLARASYAQAVCWIGMCLAEALQYAHDRELVHLDIKPSNILLEADGLPLLLDFHLSRAPIQPGGLLEGVGGTAVYMSPEQRAAMDAVRSEHHAPAGVDGRSDIYSLGLVLYEALAGKPPSGPLERLERCNRQVSVGLADIVHRCVERDPRDRYLQADDVAADLRRHLAGLPLEGVRNRSLAERWSKWRRRHPHALRLFSLALAVLLTAGAVLTFALASLAEQRGRPRVLLRQGKELIEAREYGLAADKLREGLSLAEGMPLGGGLAGDLRDQLDRAEQGKRRADAEALLEQGKKEHAAGKYDRALEMFRKGRSLVNELPSCQELLRELNEQEVLTGRARLARQLNQFVDDIRFLYGAGPLPAKDWRRLEEGCRRFWERRAVLMSDRRGTGLPPPHPLPLSPGGRGEAKSIPLSPGGRGEAKLLPLSPGGRGGRGEGQVRLDLLDLALVWTDLRARQGGADQAAAARAALEVLEEAERQFGPSRVLYRERQRHAEALGRADLALEARRGAERLAPRTGWEHYALGRSLLRAGELDAAAAELRRAVALEPRDLWANFYDGVGALRRKRYDDAVTAFTACVALAPRDAQRARCFYNRALAFTKLRRADRALGDYDWALKLDPSLAEALLNRGILHYEQNRFPAALADLRRALEKDAPPALVHYNLALVHRALGNRDDALASVQQALRHDPAHAAAGRLLKDLRGRR